ncbi:hypothetical protein [Streptomyces sp. NBC_00448]|uniref:hypothetical protein n=1 Tax=Streptomyces sp. NBC_00448 TaxID=2903652 RepID=UPI002E20B774
MRRALAATAAVGGAALLVCSLGAGTSAALGAPGCEQDTCPTASPTPTPTETTPTPAPTDGSNDDGDSGVIETAPPATPTETLTDAPTDPAGTAADPAAPTDGDIYNGVSPDGIYCIPGGWYTPTKMYGKYMRPVGAVQSDVNNTSRSATVTFNAQASATVGVSLSSKINVSVGALLAKIKAEYEITLSASVTASLSNSISTTIPAHKTVNAEYGVWRSKFTGTTHYQYADCAVTSHVVTAYGPYRVGWYLWEG